MTIYQLTNEGYVIRDGDTKVPTVDLPGNPNTNPDFLAYKAWLAAGGVPLPAIAGPAVVPASVTMRQARLALLAAGKLQLVESAIAALPDPPQTAARIEWDYSNEVLRHNGFVAMIGPSIGLDAAALDAIFIAAEKL
ncbi:hypothetical protein AVME950_02150 [Acidovorax sp. SUPP950]|uniref:hypothetical protein n=1 Tax=Acidovorax sp. SUPP950 TaxID=511901 RepID=UPI0023C54266|nr:hypothetical protein [Acidovorax sp. SUPP950]GKS73648.1 hypothetical protein AVME950_02150 [Acidovorax sp. SUPP950]